MLAFPPVTFCGCKVTVSTLGATLDNNNSFSRIAAAAPLASFTVTNTGTLTSLYKPDASLKSAAVKPLATSLISLSPVYSTAGELTNTL